MGALETHLRKEFGGDAVRSSWCFIFAGVGNRVLARSELCVLDAKYGSNQRWTHQLGGCCSDQARDDGGLHQHGSSVDDEKWLDS